MFAWALFGVGLELIKIMKPALRPNVNEEDLISATVWHRPSARDSRVNNIQVFELDEWWYRNKKYDLPGCLGEDFTGDLDPGLTAIRKKRKDTRRQDKKNPKDTGCQAPTQLDMPIVDDPKEKEPDSKRLRARARARANRRRSKRPVRSHSAEMS